jgi:hypothetical protein
METEVKDVKSGGKTWDQIWTTVMISTADVSFTIFTNVVIMESSLTTSAPFCTGKH